MARRYEFYFRVAKQYSTNERSERVKYCCCHEKINSLKILGVTIDNKLNLNEHINDVCNKASQRVGGNYETEKSNSHHGKVSTF